MSSFPTPNKFTNVMDAIINYDQALRSEIAVKIMAKHDTRIPEGDCFNIETQSVTCTCEQDANIALGLE